MTTETSSNNRSDEGRVAASGSVSPGLIAAAILLPPLALFLVQGVSRDFWIAFGLTCVGYLPGVAFALFALLKGRSSRRAPA
jgi:uncharacterized membrane protein YqaE (UPF0057 family)